MTAEPVVSGALVSYAPNAKRGDDMTLTEDQFEKLVRLIVTSGDMQAHRTKPDHIDEFERAKSLYDHAKVEARRVLVGTTDT